MDRREESAEARESEGRAAAGADEVAQPAVRQTPHTTPRGHDFTPLADVLAVAAQAIGAEAGEEGPAAVQLGESGTPSGSGERPNRCEQDLARTVARLWPEAVGPEIAANAAPVYLSRGRLVVSTSSSAWAQTLHLMSEGILARLNLMLRSGETGNGPGGGPLVSLVFRHAGWEGRRQAPAAAQGAPDHDFGRNGAQGRGRKLGRRGLGEGSCPERPDLSLEQQEALAAVSALDLPEGLKQTILRAMRAAFVRERQDSVRS